jgi:hypothetical protein
LHIELPTSSIDEGSELSNLHNFIRASNFTDTVLFQNTVLLAVPELTAVDLNSNSDVLFSSESEGVITLLQVVNAEGEVLPISLRSHFDFLKPVSKAMTRLRALD